MENKIIKLKINTRLIGEYMEKNNLSKGEFAEHCGITPIRLGKILRTDLTARVGDVLKVSYCMNVAISDMFAPIRIYIDSDGRPQTRPEFLREK